MVIFTTDALLLFLIAAITGFVVYASRREHLRGPWREVFRRRLAMAAACVLVLFIVTGALDSIRLCDGEKQDGACQGEILSLLDHGLTHLRENTEKTYSAPFALYSFNKESVELPGGGTRRDYVRLVHGGVHLDDAAARGGDILGRAVLASAAGLLGWFTIAVLVAAIANRGQQVPPQALVLRALRGNTDLPWNTLLLTGAALSVLVCVVLALSFKYHVFGTDKVGQDVLYQAIKSVRTGLAIGTLTTLVMLPFALSLGLAAGYFGGRLDDVIQYLYTTLTSIPGVLLIAAAVLGLEVYMANNSENFTSIAARADARLLFLCMVLGITSWTGLCRLLRAEALKLREMEYVQAAVAFGVGNLTVLGRHLLPNVMHIVMITIVIDFSGLVLAEAVLAYVNIGVDTSMNSWGNMINSARLELAREPLVWWSLAAAFVFMFALVLSANLFADAVRDAFDPRLRQRQ